MNEIILFIKDKMQEFTETLNDIEDFNTEDEVEEALADIDYTFSEVEIGYKALVKKLEELIQELE